MPYPNIYNKLIALAECEDLWGHLDLVRLRMQREGFLKPDPDCNKREAEIVIGDQIQVLKRLRKILLSKRKAKVEHHPAWESSPNSV